jgi:hypothetical protein
MFGVGLWFEFLRNPGGSPRHKTDGSAGEREAVRRLEVGQQGLCVRAEAAWRAVF